MTPDITIRGGLAKQRSLVLEAANYYLERLLPDNYQEVTLVVKLKKNLHEHQSLKGSCIWDDDRNDPREFEIEIDACMNTQAILEFLAHECVHVKQYVLGTMHDTSNGNIVRWKDKKYDMTKIDYYDLPWEIDAYGREKGLYEHFVKKFRYRNKRWYIDNDY